jgi:hypothetical protein
MGLIRKVIDKMLMMLLPLFTFVLSTSAKDISHNDKSHLSHTNNNDQLLHNISK